jgi:hypothetical protein
MPACVGRRPAVALAFPASMQPSPCARQVWESSRKVLANLGFGAGTGGARALTGRRCHRSACAAAAFCQIGWTALPPQFNPDGQRGPVSARMGPRPRLFHVEPTLHLDHPMRSPLVFVALGWLFVIACADNSSAISDSQCSNPAPLNGTVDPQSPDNYLVRFRDGVSLQDEFARLQQVYAFSWARIWTSIGGFAASFDPGVREMLRCEPSVASIEYEPSIPWEG